jgi:CRISPR-associated protein Cas2
MPQRQLFLAAYDVREPHRLQQALHVLRDYTCGGQKSVFECYLTAKERQRLIARMLGVLDEDEDYFLVVPLRQSTPVRAIGMATTPVDAGFLYIG